MQSDSLTVSISLAGSVQCYAASNQELDGGISGEDSGDGIYMSGIVYVDSFTRPGP